MTYSQEFYDIIRAGCVASAEVVVPLVHQIVRPRAVVDVGCGEGIWAAEFAKLGADVAGIDGDYVGSPVIDRFVGHDLLRPLPDIGRFDLAVSLEVAEHLPRRRAETFVEELCALAPVVLFSAAIPGQGGAGHLNEQWPAYWANLFDACGYECSGALRWQIWNDDRVENWYRQNLMVARSVKHAPPLREWFNTPLAPMWPVVHPVLYDARRG